MIAHKFATLAELCFHLELLFIFDTRIEPRVLPFLGKCCATELHALTRNYILKHKVRLGRWCNV